MRFYRQGLTDRRLGILLLRELLPIVAGDSNADINPFMAICVTDHMVRSGRRSETKVFEYTANLPFQSDNTIPVPLTSYVRDGISASNGVSDKPRPNHLVDVYCGSGLFAISFSGNFGKVVGIELLVDQIPSATHNAALNGYQDKSLFLSSDTANIFWS